ncbi:MAG: cell surface protein [Planctomycetia bacterium]|nr:cell surface protein [Planctomycetia bacterium]
MKRTLISAVFPLILLCMSVASAENADYSRTPGYVGPHSAIASKDQNSIFVIAFDGAKIIQIDTNTEKVVRELDAIPTPTSCALWRDDSKLLVTSAQPHGVVACVDLASGKTDWTIPVGYCPESIVVHPNGKMAYVANRFSTDVSVLDLEAQKEIKRIPTLREPISVDITPDGKTVYVANFIPIDRADGYDVAAEVTWIDTETYESDNIRLLNGCVALHEVSVSADGKYAFVTNNLARYQMPTTQLERGWMNTNAVAILDAENRKLINVVLLDDIDLGAANPWGVKLTTDGATLVVSHAGTHELSVIDATQMFKKLADIAAQDQAEGDGQKSNSGYSSARVEDVPNDLAFLVGMRTRVKLSGNGPRSVVFAKDKVFVPMFFSDTVAVVNLPSKKQTGEIALNPEFELTVERYGHQCFNDGTLCFQQWQSCASCHPYTRNDSLNWDLMNDGLGNPKNAKSLLFSHETPPTMISGIRADAEHCVRSGFTHILFSVRPEKDPASIDEYLKSMKALPSPYLVNGELSEAAKRGKEIFYRVKCDECHDPEWYYTDMQMHDVDTKAIYDQRRDWDCPTLCECWRTAPYLHDGRYTTMLQLFKEGKHGVQKGPVDKLSDEELDDLVEFVLSL